MDAPSKPASRRTLGVVAALLLAGAAVLLVATLIVGNSIWPPRETSVERRLGTEPAVLEAKLATGAPSADLRIGVVGDIQNGISELGDLLDSFRDAHVDFLLQLGDASNEGEPGRYAVLRKMFEEHAPGTPVIAVPGNHDIEPDDTTAVWTEWVGPAQWRIDANGWRILGIDDSTGEISAASMELLRRAAADPAPAGGTIVVAHRPLGAREKKDSVDARARALAATGIVPAMTFCGHWHVNDTYTDAKGTIHYLLGENCDRSSSGSDPTMSRALLVLRAGAPEHELEMSRIPRHVTFKGEFLRLAGGIVYPRLRDHAVFVWLGALLAFVAAGGIARRALRP